jgi:hypothetical protein
LAAFRGDFDRFPRPAAFKVNDADDIVSPPNLLPPFLDDNPPPQPQPGQWVVPFLLYIEFQSNGGIPYEPPPDLDLACFIQTRRAPTSSATGTYGVTLNSRAKPPRTETEVYCPPGETDPPCSGNTPEARSLGEYGFFTPSPDTYTLLDAGDPALGTCDFPDPTQPQLNHVEQGGANGWNCCTWVYTPDPPTVESQFGFSSFWVGGAPSGPIPDDDFDGVINRCDNCPNFPANLTQTDSDFDGVGDVCDNCSEVGNLAQTDSDLVPAGDDCQCSDLNDDAQVDILDAAVITRFSLGYGSSAAFDYDRCKVDFGSLTCTLSGALGVRQSLAGIGTPLVESCP